jgi:hypothetical protein
MATVWTFTNQRELNKSEFLNYIERKVFRTIRKFDMLPKSKIITLKKANDLNTQVLKHIIEKKFPVKFSTKPNLLSDNLSQIAEDIFKNILKGNYHYSLQTTHYPLRLISDKELELYAKLSSIKGTKRKQDKKIQTLFEKFLKKNQDLELNIIKAMGQLK